jgi:hypothetical protein
VSTSTICHATVLHLPGIDHERLTYRHGGHAYRLTDVHGQVVRESWYKAAPPPSARARRATKPQNATFVVKRRQTSPPTFYHKCGVLLPLATFD